MNPGKLSIYVMLLLSLSVRAAQESDYLGFFDRYQELSRNFDVSVTQLYSDEAEIIGVRKMPDGVEQTLRVEGKKWKEMIYDAMELGKQRGDISEFSDIKVRVEGNRAKITATRYATVKCYYDKRYYMIISAADSGELQISEEFMESPVESECANAPENDLPLVLKGAAVALNKQLPIMVDGDTRLESASSDGSTLIYHFVLVNYLSTELNAEVLEGTMRPIVTEQTCSMPNLKPVLGQGGLISYQYKGKDHESVLVIDIDKNDCL